MVEVDRDFPVTAVGYAYDLASTAQRLLVAMKKGRRAKAKEEIEILKSQLAELEALCP